MQTQPRGEVTFASLPDSLQLLPVVRKRALGFFWVTYKRGRRHTSPPCFDVTIGLFTDDYPRVYNTHSGRFCPFCLVCLFDRKQWMITHNMILCRVQHQFLWFGGTHTRCFVVVLRSGQAVKFWLLINQVMNVQVAIAIDLWSLQSPQQEAENPNIICNKVQGMGLLKRIRLSNIFLVMTTLQMCQTCGWFCWLLFWRFPCNESQMSRRPKGNALHFQPNMTLRNSCALEMQIHKHVNLSNSKR